MPGLSWPSDGTPEGGPFPGTKASVASLSATGMVRRDRVSWGPKRGQWGRPALPHHGRASLWCITVRCGEEREGLQPCWGVVALESRSQAACGVPRCQPLHHPSLSTQGSSPWAPEQLLWKKTSPAWCSASSPGGAWAPCRCESRPLCSTGPPDAPALLYSAQTGGLEGLRRGRSTASTQRSKRYYVSESESGK